jgi:type IV secretory pathway VirJ component
VRVRAILGALMLVLLTPACAPRVEVESRSEGRLGSIRIFQSTTPQGGLVFLFSDASGWNRDLSSAAQRIARHGALVVGVDLPSYLSDLRASDDGCHYVIAELEDLSHRLQREHGFASYRSPILAGIGAGGTLAYAALAQSPAATVDGAVSIDPAEALATRVPLCPGAPATADPAGGFRYGARRDLPGYWWVNPRAALPGPLAAIAGEPPGAPQKGSPELRLAALVVAALALKAPTAASLRDLPIVELPVATAATQMAVIYSGDGGWRDLDKQIAGVLVHDGTPVVGVDCLRYFWREKTPDLVAADLARILRHYRARWDAEGVLLIGYSFGAGILPFAFNRLPPDLKDAVVQISLLGLESTAPFQISVRGWLGAHDGGLPVLPELRSLELRRVQCFYGEEETDTLCTAPEFGGAERIRMPGGHHFGGDYQRLARLILQGAAQRSTPRGGPRSR